MSKLRVQWRWLQILKSCKNNKLLLQSLQNTDVVFASAGCDKKILMCLLWVTSCANLKTRAFHLGFFGLTSHKWFLKQEELTSSLLSAFKFPDCIVKQREPVSAHIHRVILVGRDISRSPGQVSLTAGPTRSGCSGLCRYFSISKDSQSFWVPVTAFDHTMVKIFSCIKICLSMLTPCACCLLSCVLCAPLGKKSVLLSCICKLSISSSEHLQDFPFPFSARIRQLFEVFLLHYVFQIPNYLGVPSPNSPQQALYSVLSRGAQNWTQCIDVDSQVSNGETIPFPNVLATLLRHPNIVLLCCKGAKLTPVQLSVQSDPPLGLFLQGKQYLSPVERHTCTKGWTACNHC